MQVIGQCASRSVSFQLWRRKDRPVKKAFWLKLKVTFAYSTLDLGCDDLPTGSDSPGHPCIYQNAPHLHGMCFPYGHPDHSNPDGICTPSIVPKSPSPWRLPVNSIPLIPLIYIVPLDLRSNQTLAVYLAELIADFFAVSFYGDPVPSRQF